MLWISVYATNASIENSKRKIKIIRWVKRLSDGVEGQENEDKHHDSKKYPSTWWNKLDYLGQYK